MDIDKKYVVLDLETNGISRIHDDLLSISIFKPDDGLMYNRFLPLEMAKHVYTTEINGITKSMLIGKKPLTQKEFNDVCDKFELDKRIILTYTTFDKDVLRNYLVRKNINGFEKLTFYDIKSHVFSSRFSFGSVTKDNLCKLFNIDNVTEVHSGENDCRLEWELFKKIYDKRLIIINNSVYEFNSDYIIPASFLYSHTKLKKYLPNIPKIHAHVDEIKRFEINRDNIHRFENNISGMTIEHLINSMLNVKKIDSFEFLYENKRKLKYIGKLETEEHTIPVSFNRDGTVSFMIKEEKALVGDTGEPIKTQEEVIAVKKLEKEVNDSLLTLKEEIRPVVEYIKKLFNTDTIYSQELVVNKDANILGLCDLSNESTILEIKTTVLDDPRDITYQLYYCCNGRECYLFEMDWGNYKFPKISFIFSKVTFIEGRGRRQIRDTSKQKYKDYVKTLSSKRNSEDIDSGIDSNDDIFIDKSFTTKNDEEKQYTTNDLVKMTGLSRQQIYRLHKEKGLPLHKESNRYQIKQSDYEHWVEKQRKSNIFKIVVFIVGIIVLAIILIIAINTIGS